jgi:Glycosyl transferase family 2
LTRSAITEFGDKRGSFLGSLPDQEQARWAHGLLALARQVERFIVVIAPWRPPPLRTDRDDGILEHFACDPETFATVTKAIPRGLRGNHLYRILFALLQGALFVDRLVVAQRPSELTSRVAARTESYRLVVPHRGPTWMLEVLLERLASDGHLPRTCIALDEPRSARFARLIARYPRAMFWRAADPPVGPHAIRDAVIRQLRSRYMIFQDSDDLPTSDRVPRLLAALRRGRDRVVGSHELRVDQLSQCVRAIRFPIDASEALRQGGAHVQLHGTIALGRALYLRSGGLETSRMFASDSQFTLRSVLFAPVRNLDAFLYVRHVRPASLTTSLSTGLVSSERRELSVRWWRAFERVLAGQLRLEDSDLWPTPRHPRARLVAIP